VKIQKQSGIVILVGVVIWVQVGIDFHEEWGKALASFDPDDSDVLSTMTTNGLLDFGCVDKPLMLSLDLDFNRVPDKRVEETSEFLADLSEGDEVRV